MNKAPYQANKSHIVVQVVKNFIARIRQNPEIYPIRYYKKNRKFRPHFKADTVK